MTRPPFILDRYSPYLLNRLAARISRRLAREYGERFGITIAEWRVLAHLAGSEGISVRDIEARVDLDRSKVSRAVNRLESKGYVDKLRNTDDQRLLILSLTPAGRGLFERIAPVALDFERRLLDGLSAGEREALFAAIDKLFDRLEAME